MAKCVCEAADLILTVHSIWRRFEVKNRFMAGFGESTEEGGDLKAIDFKLCS